MEDGCRLLVAGCLLLGANHEVRFVDICTPGIQIRRQLQASEPDSSTVAGLEARFVDSCRLGREIRRQLHAWKPDSSTVAGLGTRFADSRRL